MHMGDTPPIYTQPIQMKVRALSVSDIKNCLVRGFADMLAAPIHSLMIGLICALFGIAIVACVSWLGIPWMIYPFAIGFPLAGPFLAVGLYEISRRLEAGEPVIWDAIISRMWMQRRRELSWMAFVCLFVIWVWVYQVRILMAIFLGFLNFSTLDGFVKVVFTTSQGWWFLAVGHVIGAVLATVLFSLTVVSTPLLLEREVDVITAMIISVKAVFASPLVMVSWGLLVTLLVILASLPLFLGLIFVLPILGHTTWHIYRRAIE
jgi:uncharacterized membrane protein